ncbi:class I SAM-dependent methyltransferase [Croceicoccus sp. Ery5]|uniref:class I SAM-dependent methyltransferase n=1 Tax=Croceicoccus sp. Ery5 TaxID=1703340 RepID=UPI001E552BC0|nr:class I SAM-dependent methyltransferase [Croceicoccus sp. Ery5]
MSGTHSMLPVANHDETAEQLFVRDLKGYIAGEIEPFESAAADALDPGAGHNDRAAETYARLRELSGFSGYLGLRRAAQDLLWDCVGVSVGRQADSLASEAASIELLGSLTLDPDMVQPAYLEDRDVHLMPGGYAHDRGDVTQGALMDRGGAVYMLGRNGGFLNDGRGWTLASHLLARWPDMQPASLIELGCGVGASAVPLARTFPDSDVYGLDVGGSVLRYAQARASALGVAVHFVQGDAEHAPFPDASFDCVCSSVMLHETSPDALGAIMAESLRLLKPGGIVAHLEVPQRYDSVPLWTQIRGEIELDYNNEPNWRSAISADYENLLRAAGFVDVMAGYQDAVGEAVPANNGFGTESKGVFRSWFVASGRKPQ